MLTVIALGTGALVVLVVALAVLLWLVWRVVQRLPGRIDSVGRTADAALHASNDTAYALSTIDATSLRSDLDHCRKDVNRLKMAAGWGGGKVS